MQDFSLVSGFSRRVGRSAAHSTLRTWRCGVADFFQKESAREVFNLAVVFVLPRLRRNVLCAASNRGFQV